jgi:hypothetical protein
MCLLLLNLEKETNHRPRQRIGLQRHDLQSILFGQVLQIPPSPQSQMMGWPLMGNQAG